MCFVVSSRVLHTRYALVTGVQTWLSDLSGGGRLLTSFANAPEATLYGAELEFQRGFDLSDWGGFFATKQVLAIANYTFTNSDIAVKDGDVTFIPPAGAASAQLLFTDGDALTGQSDHIANVPLGLDATEKTQQFTFLFNYADRKSTRLNSSH